MKAGAIWPEMAVVVQHLVWAALPGELFSAD